jgi:peptide/nickel transport system permease protein
MLRIIVRRLSLAIPMLLTVSAMSFVLLSFAPGDAATTILGTLGNPEQYAATRHRLGLDLPLYEQYWRWLVHALHGDLGLSLLSGDHVSTMISDRLPVTASLVASSLLVTLVVGVAFGVFSAVRGGVAGRFVDSLSLVGFALPGFWVGAVLIELFAVKAHWFPAIGYVPLTQSPWLWVRSLVLPVIALSLGPVAAVAKNTREAMLDSLASEHVRMAWASGVPRYMIFFKYALRDAALRVVTIMSLITIGLLGGTLLAESVFALPGLGGALVNASVQHDIPSVQGIAVVFTLVIVCVNLLTDLSYSWLDPRIRAR